MYHVFIYSSVDGLLGYFHILAIVYSTALNSGMHVPFWTLFFQVYHDLIDWLNEWPLTVDLTSSPSPLPGGQGVGLKVQTLHFWLFFLVISTPL